VGIVSSALQETGPYGANALHLAPSLGELRALIGAEGVTEAAIGGLFVGKNAEGLYPLVAAVEASNYALVCHPWMDWCTRGIH
jgi:hypothetical protein